MGVESYLVTSTLNAVLAQRLVRKLCMECRQPYTPAVQFMADTVLRDTPTFYKAGGCEACGNTGYHGRMVITELLVLSDEVRALIVDRADARAIGRAAMKTGMRTMYEDGMAKVRAGLTTIDDVMRVTREA
jgi:general secretion pathway protein E